MKTNEEILKKIVTAFNTGDLSEVDLIFSQNYIDHQNDQDRPSDSSDGPEEFKMIVTGARRSLPNLRVMVEDVINSADQIVARLQWHSIDEVGKKIDRETIEILKIEGGQVVEHWGAEEWNSGRN